MIDMMGPQKGRKAVRFVTKVPMRYVVRSEHVKTAEVKKGTITDMSSGGIAFETEEQLAEGVTIAVEIILRQDIVVEAIGKVARVTPPESGEGTYYEVALSFTEISETAKEEINMWFYSQKLSRGTAAAHVREAERKESEHFRAGRAFVQYRQKRLLGREPWQEAEIKQVSKYGVIVTATGAAKESEAWEIMIYLPAHSEAIKALATVVTVRREGSASEIALEFTKIKDSDRKRVSESAISKS